MIHHYASTRTEKIIFKIGNIPNAGKLQKDWLTHITIDTMEKYFAIYKTEIWPLTDPQITILGNYHRQLKT